MNPDYAIPPHEMHASLIGALHRAVAHHPHAQTKAEYGRMLHQALVMQAKTDAEQRTAGAVAGNPTGGPAQVPEQLPPQTGYIDQNITPLQQALTSAGGYQNLNPAGILATILAGQHTLPPIHRFSGLPGLTPGPATY